MIKIKDLPNLEEVEGNEYLIVQPIEDETKKIDTQTLIDLMTEKAIETAQNDISNDTIDRISREDWRLNEYKLRCFIESDCRVGLAEKTYLSATFNKQPGNFFRKDSLTSYVKIEDFQNENKPLLEGQLIFQKEKLYYYKRDFSRLPVYYYPDIENLTEENFDVTKIKNIYNTEGITEDFLNYEIGHGNVTLNPSETIEGLPSFATFFILTDLYYYDGGLIETGGGRHGVIIVNKRSDVFHLFSTDPYNFGVDPEDLPEEALDFLCYTPPFSDLNFWQQINFDFSDGLITLQNGQYYLQLRDWENGINYKKGSLVTHENTLYLCTEDHTSSDWNIDNSSGYWNSSGGEGGVLNFVKNKPYKAGSLVVYANNLYQRITSGRDTEWIPENWYLLTNANVSSLFVKYAHLVPLSDDDMLDDPAEYIGISYGNYATAPAHFENYQWYKIKGEDGTINLEANSLVLKYLLEVDNWIKDEDNTCYYQTITRDNFGTNSNNRKIMNLVTASTRPIADVELSEIEETTGEDGQPAEVINTELWNHEIESYSKITAIITDDNSSGGGKITFYCLSKPKYDFTIKLRIHGDIHEDRFVTTTAFQTYQNTIENQRVSLQNQIDDLQDLIGSMNTALEEILEGGE